MKKMILITSLVCSTLLFSSEPAHAGSKPTLSLIAGGARYLYKAVVDPDSNLLEDGNVEFYNKTLTSINEQTVEKVLGQPSLVEDLIRICKRSRDACTRILHHMLIHDTEKVIQIYGKNGQILPEYMSQLTERYLDLKNKRINSLLGKQEIEIPRKPAMDEESTKQLVMQWIQQHPEEVAAMLHQKSPKTLAAAATTSDDDESDATLTAEETKKAAPGNQASTDIAHADSTAVQAPAPIQTAVSAGTPKQGQVVGRMPKGSNKKRNNNASGE